MSTRAAPTCLVGQRLLAFGLGSPGVLYPTLLTMCHNVCHPLFMPTVNIRQLRDTRRLKAWLRAGTTVQLRDRVIAHIVPEPVRAPPRYPDFGALRREIFGDRILPGSDLLIEERRRSRY